MVTRYQRDIDYVKSLHGDTIDQGETIKTGEFLKQIFKLYGVGKSADLIEAGLEGSGYHAARRQATIDAVKSIHQAHSKTRGKKQLVIPERLIEDAVLDYDINGINLNNKFWVDFLGNPSISLVQQDVMAIYCSEVTQSPEEISMDRLDLGFIQNEDVSDITHGKASFTFIVDKNLIVYNALKNITNRMRNRKTGRYGYRDDYSFEEISIITLDGYNHVYNSTYLIDCVVTGIDGLNRSKSNSDFQTIQMSVSFDRYETF